MFKPVMPSLADFIAHSFIHDYHIATVHHSHGENHVHAEVQRAAKEENQNENTPKQKNVEPVAVHIASVSNFNALTEYSFEEYSVLHLLTFNQPLRWVNVPPPKTLT